MSLKLFFTFIALAFVQLVSSECVELTEAQRLTLTNCKDVMVQIPGDAAAKKFAFFYNKEGGGDPAQLDTGAATRWLYVDQDTSAATAIDWSMESQDCKANFMALACSYEFTPCTDQSTTCTTNCEMPHNIAMKTAVTEECTQAIWTKEFPDFPSLSSSFVMTLNSTGITFPDEGSAETSAAVTSAVATDATSTAAGTGPTTMPADSGNIVAAFNALIATVVLCAVLF